MSVNQAQVDHIITAASADDPEVKLQNLEREVDLVKVSIKRLLMDIRERMNDLENPFTLGSGNKNADSGVESEEANRSAMEAREAALEARESQLEAEIAKREAEDAKDKTIPPTLQKAPEAAEEKKIYDGNMLAVMTALAGSHQKAQKPVEPEKPKLQEVYHLFRWTSQVVKKFGHDRAGIMLEAFCVMGYVPRKSADEIRQLVRLMPANLGEEQEVTPDEFVYQIYTLNRIIVPEDTSLDRSMIEVMMEKRKEPAITVPSEEGRAWGRAVPSGSGEKNDMWTNLQA